MPGKSPGMTTDAVLGRPYVPGANQACLRASPNLAFTSAILARLTGTRWGDGPSSSITAPSPSLRTKETCGIATIWLRCTRTNRLGSSWASASEIDHVQVEHVVVAGLDQVAHLC